MISTLFPRAMCHSYKRENVFMEKGQPVDQYLSDVNVPKNQTGIS